MPSSHGTLLVLGSGPGIGVNVAKLFAERGFRRVILASRDSDRLAKEVDEVKAAAEGVHVVAVTIDLADKDSIQTGLEQAEGHLGDQREGMGLECVLFNAARVGPSRMFDFSSEEMDRDFHISVTSLYVAAVWALPKLVEGSKDANARPSFLVTSGGLAKEPYPHMFSLAMCKAAQYSFVWSLSKQYGPAGVHCALLVVQGFVKPEAQVATPRNIAEKGWELFLQEKGSFDLEIDIVDPEYTERLQKGLTAQRKN